MDEMDTPVQPEEAKIGMSKGKKIGIICAIVAGVLVVAAIVILVLVLSNKKESKPAWSEQYYAYLEKAAAENKAKDVGLEDNTKYMLSFLKFDDYEQPVMALRAADGKMLNLYYIKGEDEIDYITNRQKLPSDDISLEYLYDNYREVYDYFAHYTRNKKISEYIALGDELKNGGESQTSYIIDKDDARSAKDYELNKTYSVSQYDQTFVAPDIQLPEEKEIFFTPDEAKFAENKAVFLAAVAAYKPIDELLTNDKKTLVTEKASETNELLNLIADLIADQTITSDNFHEFIDEDLKYFMAAYQGALYGWNTIYKYESHPSSECEAYKPLPSGITQYSSCFLLVGAGSKAKMKEELLKHISESVLKNIDNKYIAGTLGDFDEFNNNVWWVLEGGVGGIGYDSLSPANATFMSVNESTGSVTVRWKLYQLNDITDNFTITLAPTEGDYKVISYTHSDK